MGLVKEKFGLVYSAFFPIGALPENSHPVYGGPVDLGAAVKAYLTINYAEAQLFGDDVLQLDLREFTGAQLDAETLLNDLEVEAQVFGSTMEAGVLTDHKDDNARAGGYGYIQKLKTQLGTVFRACFLYYVRARMTADNADTRGSSITFANNAITYGVMPDNTGAWRSRQDFSTEADAKAFLQGLATAVSGGAYAVKVAIVGNGSSAQKNTAFITAGQSYTVTFGTAPTKLFDGSTDVTAQLADTSYTLSNINADHQITAIF